MRKIIVIGCPGSGKSTFSRALCKRTGLPLYHLDLMYWNEDRTTVEKSVFRERLSALLKKDEWIIDGNYASTMEERIRACDTVFFLDYPSYVCLEGIEARIGKARSDMPWVETEPDGEFIEYVKRFNEHQRPLIAELLGKYSDRDIYVFISREQADEFLNNLCEKH